MENKERPVMNNCSLFSLSPAIMALPYPATQVRGQNQKYAQLLSIDYCGSVSELSAITQYINHENRLSCEKCPFAKILLQIAMAEMIHLQKLGELIYLLGGSIDFVAKPSNGSPKMWSPAYLSIPENAKQMIWENIKGEKAAISQYKMHIKMIKDDYVQAVLLRIIKDEEYHIMLLKGLLEEI